MNKIELTRLTREYTELLLSIPLYIIAPRTFASPHLFILDSMLLASFTALEDDVTKESPFKFICEKPDILKGFLNVHLLSINEPNQFVV